MNYLQVSLFFLFCSLGHVNAQEICNNGIDDDGNGLIDLNDPGCMLNCNGFGDSSNVYSLISNPSFEDTSCCPTFYTQGNGLTDYSCATGWQLATQATTDYYNSSCGFMPAHVPQPLPDGNGCVGGIFYQEWMEYVGKCLTLPMEAGTEYQFRFNIAAAQSMSGNFIYCGPINYGPVELTLYGSGDCNTMPVLTSDCPSAGTGFDPSWTVLGSMTYNPINLWSSVTITTTPNTNINAVMVGAPCDLPADYINDPMNDVSDTCLKYFYFDNFILKATESFQGLSINKTGRWQENNTQLNAMVDSIAGSYQWFLNGVALVGETDTILNIESFCSDTLEILNYTFIQTIGINCASANYSLEVPIYPTSSFMFNGLCAGTETVFTDSSNADSNTLVSWFWDFGDGSNSYLQNPVHQFNQDGVYQIVLIIADSICADTSSIPITIHRPPIGDFMLNNACVGTDILFTDLSISFGTTEIIWYWKFGDGNTSSLQNPVHLYETPGIFNVQLIVVDSICSDTISYLDTVFQKPIAIFNLTPNTGITPLSVYFENNSIGGNQSLWIIGDSITTQENNPTVFFEIAGEYSISLIITNANECSDSSSAILSLFNSSWLYAPNVFTPNGDGDNDLFKFKGKYILSFAGEIRNRWGRIVYIWDNINNGWDGTYNGQNVPMGTYYYTVNVTGVDGVNYLKKGVVQLFR